MEIVVICGSVRFKNEMLGYRDEQMTKGKWILLPENMDIDIQKIDRRVKDQMDQLHLKKIDCADKVIIWNREGYMGESTRRELSYSLKNNKAIEFIEKAYIEEAREMTRTQFSRDIPQVVLKLNNNKNEKVKK